MFRNETEENQSITIHCFADVGNPNRYIQIWGKNPEKSSTFEVIYKSNTTNSKTEKTVQN